MTEREGGERERSGERREREIGRERESKRQRERERCYFGEIFVHLNCYDTLLSCNDF